MEVNHEDGHLSAVQFQQLTKGMRCIVELVIDNKNIKVEDNTRELGFFDEQRLTC